MADGRKQAIRIDRSLVSGFVFFDGIAAGDMDDILSAASSARYPENSDVFRQGENAQSFYFLLDGHIRVLRTNSNGSQVIARYISAGEIFGIAPALGRTTYPATAQAAVDCVALSWPTDLWKDFSTRYPQFASHTYATVGDRFQATEDKVLALTTEQVEQRVANALLKLVRQVGKKNEDGIDIDFPISRQDIADMTGTTLHTVSRLLSAWEKRGLIKSGRRRVTIVEPHKLVLIAEGRDL